MIEAVTALRRYRDDVGRQPRRAIPARLAADGYDADRASRSRGSRGFEFVPEDGTATSLADVAIPGGAVQVLRHRRDRPRGGRAPQRPRSASSSSGEIERAESKLANEELRRRRRRPRWSRREREKLERYRRELDELGE